MFCTSDRILFLVFVLVSLDYIVINVSAQYNGGLLPDNIRLTLCGYIWEPLQYHVELLSLQLMVPPKPFD